ncbi:1376_t:CDS:2 [Gigaspora rosea]|nr:1376_t:CDS:2 [Gigaspora rosea]
MAIYFLYTSEEPDLENLSLKDSSDLKSEKQKNKTSETKFEATVGDTELTLKPVTNDKVVEGDLGKFAERLELNKFTENKNEWKKFYVVDPDWDPIGEELAANALEYCLLFDLEKYFFQNEKSLLDFPELPTPDTTLLEQSQQRATNHYIVQDGLIPIEASGYGDGVKEIVLGDGTVWLGKNHRDLFMAKRSN